MEESKGQTGQFIHGGRIATTALIMLEIHHEISMHHHTIHLTIGIAGTTITCLDMDSYTIYTD